MTIGKVNIGDLFIWKMAVLSEAVRAFADPEMQEIQRATGVWEHGGKINYPTETDISVIKTGCMTFIRKIGPEDILFSVWMQPGEVRVGVKIPRVYATTKPQRDKLSAMFDGKDADRVNDIDQHTFFDWIWKNEEFASFEFMIESIHDEMKAAVLAERISSAVTHLYLATVSCLITLMKFKIVDGNVIPGGMDVWTVLVGGDMATLEWYLERNGGLLIDQKMHSNQKHMQCRLHFPTEKRKLIDVNVGQRIQDPDGGVCMIAQAVMATEQ